MKVKGMKQAGFSLVELMVVVGIIGILAAIAVPRFQVFTAKAKQSEAKGNLRALDTLEQAYFAENGKYDTVSNVGYTQPVGTYASPTIVLPAAGGYTATIGLVSGKQLCAGRTTDNWTINQDSVLTGSVVTTCN
jgi:prepilin-type N-terminal cleavage/methylation domain-containing protein